MGRQVPIIFHNLFADDSSDRKIVAESTNPCNTRGCTRCEVNVELSLHVIRDCILAKDVWNLL